MIKNTSLKMLSKVRTKVPRIEIWNQANQMTRSVKEITIQNLMKKSKKLVKSRNK